MCIRDSISTIRPPSNRAGRSPPESSRAPVVTSSKTAWTSPAPVGDWTAPKPSSNSVRYTATATSTPTGTTTSRENENAYTHLATTTTPSHKQHDPSEEPHPYLLTREGKRREPFGTLRATAVRADPPQEERERLG